MLSSNALFSPNNSRFPGEILGLTKRNIGVKCTLDAGSDSAMQAEGEKLWETYLAALHSSHGESASQHALLRSGMHAIAESLVACRFKPLSGGAGAALLALENSLRQVLQRLMVKQQSQTGTGADRYVPEPLLCATLAHSTLLVVVQ